MIFRSKKISEAKEVILCPAERGIICYFYEPTIKLLKEMLEGIEVKKGDIIIYDELPKVKKRREKEEKEWGKEFTKFFDSITISKFKVLHTMPSGKVKISKTTELKVEPYEKDENGIRKDAIIKVEEVPKNFLASLKKKIKISIDGMQKIAEQEKMVFKLITKNETIYFTEKYYTTVVKKD